MINADTTTITESYEMLPKTIMSNLDHTINHDVGEKLKTGKYYSQYSGWNFCGYVWWNENKWSCEVWQYNEIVDVIHATNLAHIMIMVSEKYGDE